ncbi:hypothetical protein THOM_0848 [Trachipleistophora hominis]|uniref:Uncharacterized protein n=1 Tax=Trachipleistophora hominis TaxID=72359 RepID=L7JY08_TRAHO|nr:hypothetical protein THOM_0848 [Trachipleistophora hominis]
MFVLPFFLSINTLRILRLRTEPDLLVGLSDDKLLNLELKPVNRKELNSNGVLVKNRVVYFYRARLYYSMGIAADDITVKGHKADISIDKKMERMAAFKHTKVDFFGSNKVDGDSKGTMKDSANDKPAPYSPFNFSFVGAKTEQKEAPRDDGGARAADSASFFASMNGKKQGQGKLANGSKRSHEGMDTSSMNGNPLVTENFYNRQPAYAAELSMASYTGKANGNPETGTFTHVTDSVVRGNAGSFADPRQRTPLPDPRQKDASPDPYQRGPPDPYQRGPPDPYQRGPPDQYQRGPSDPYPRDSTIPPPLQYQSDQNMPIDLFERKYQPPSSPFNHHFPDTPEPSNLQTHHTKSHRNSHTVSFHIESDSSMETEETNQIHQACIYEVSENHFQLKNDNLCITYFKEQFIFAPCTKSKSQHFTLVDAKKLIENEESESEEQLLLKRRKVGVENDRPKEVVSERSVAPINFKIAKDEPKEKKVVVTKTKDSDNFIEQLKSTFDEKAIKEIINM